MHLKIVSVSLLLSLVSALPISGRAQSSSQYQNNGESILGKWVHTRQLISAKRSNWHEQKELLSYNVELLKTEIRGLDEQIAEAEEQAGEAERKQNVLRREEATLRDAAAIVEKKVRAYEADIHSLVKRFPEPLVDRISQFLAQIPVEPGASDLSLSERIIAVLRVFEEVDRFNKTVTVMSELRRVESGEIVEVKTLYLGLAQAYFVDGNKEFAAIGRPGAHGWVWTPDENHASEIGRSIAMYENLIKPADFVELPVSLD